MLRRLGIRGKVLAALSVPVLVLFVLAGVVSLGSIREAQTARTATTMLTALQESRDVVTAMQAERRSALAYAAGNTSVEAEIESSRKVTDDAIKAFDRAIERVDLGALDPSVSNAVADVRAVFDTLGGIRERADTPGTTISGVFNGYARAIDDTILFTTAVADGLDDRRLAAIIAANGLVTAMVEGYNGEQALGAVVIDGSRGPEILTFLSTLFPTTDLAHVRAAGAVEALGLGEDVVVPRLGASGNSYQSYIYYRVQVVTGAAHNLNAIDPESWTSAAAQEIRAFTPVDSTLRMEASNRARDVASAALRTSALTIAGSLAAVVLSIIAALAISRQIILPLRRLTDAAETVRDELPTLVGQVAVPGQGPDLQLTQIPVTGNDEISHLAAAFNDVNATTIQVAQEQAALRGSIAEMFVNVARRDQALLNRQLSFIDALERSEEDPATLADLFRLDHLATRMRRNAESLLVLAGIDTGRRLREPLPISDVIRTASSEIEHYERVQLDLPVDPMMLGHTALPAAHMMAELLENATVFSEPGTPVHVSTGVDEDHVLVTILDHGLGMSPEELEQANSRMLATSAGEVLGSERLGMFVVGRIAARLGAEVHLSTGPDGTGTLATIRLPLVLFTDAASIPNTAPAQAPRVETFASIDEAAGAAPLPAQEAVPAGVGDVAPGAVGSAQNPAEEIDLGSLTDGATGLGLPRRRSRAADVEAPAPSRSYREEDDAAAAPSIPLAPRADSLAGATGTTDDEVWTPPTVQESSPLGTRRSVGAPDGDAPDAPATGTGATDEAPALPTRRSVHADPLTSDPLGADASSTPAGEGLPTRRSTRGEGLPVRTPTAPVAPDALSTPSAGASGADGAASTPEGRSAMFSGFRSRRAELAAAAVQVDQGDGTTDPTIGTQDGAERLAAVAAGAAAFFGRSPSSTSDEPDEPPMVIPALVDDDEEYDDEEYFSADHTAESLVTDPPTVAEQPAADEYAAVDQSGYAGAESWSTNDEAEVAWPPPPPAPPAPVEAEPPAQVPGPASYEPAGPTSFTPAPLEAAPSQIAPPEPAATDGVVPVPSAGSPTAGASTAEFNELIGDEPTSRASRRDGRRAKRGWFRRKRADKSTPVAETPAAGAPADKATEFTPVVGFGVGQPLPPSAWDLDAITPADGAGPEGTALAEAAATPPSTVPARAVDLPTNGAPADGAPTDGQDGINAWAPPSSVLPQPEQSSTTWHPAADPVPDPASRLAPSGSSFTPAAADEHPAYLADQGQRADEPQHAGPFGQPTSFQPEPLEGSFKPEPLGTESTFGPEPAQFTSAPTFGSDQPVVPSPRPASTAEDPAASAPSAPAASAPAAAPHAPGPQTFTPQTFTPQTFTPQTGAGVDDEVTSMLAQRADLAQQALSELSQLSTYRPKAAAGGSSLTRRTPGTIPAAPEIKTAPSGRRAERDAHQVRSLLSSFQSGTSRGREALGSADGAEADPGNGDPPPGAPPGPNGHGDPVTTPDTDLTQQRSTSW